MMSTDECATASYNRYPQYATAPQRTADGTRQPVNSGGASGAQPLGSDKSASARIEFHRKSGVDGSRELCCGGGVVRPEFVSHAVGQDDLDRTRAASAYSCLLNDFKRNGGAYLVAIDDDSRLLQGAGDPAAADDLREEDTTETTPSGSPRLHVRGHLI